MGGDTQPRTSAEVPCLTGPQYRLQRALEVIPAAMVWLTLAAPALLFFWAPSVAALVLPLYVIYWMVRYGGLATRQLVEFVRLRAQQRVDWQRHNANVHGAAADRMRHLVLLPTYSEEPSILHASIDAIAASAYHNAHIIICVSVEQRSPVWTEQMITDLEARYAGRFGGFLITRHPDGLPGEEGVKGANLTWAVRHARAELHRWGIDDGRVIVSAFDADTRPSRNYFAVLTDTHLSNPQRDIDSYQPILMYHNNIWDVPAVSRIVGAIASFWTVVDSTQPDKMRIFSSHAIGMTALVHVGYWSRTVIPDDSRQYWRMFFASDGRARTRPLHTPVYLDAVQARDFRSTLREQYLQLRRWAYGVIDFPYIVRRCLTSPQISLPFRIVQVLRQYLQFQLWATTPILLLIIPRITPVLHERFPGDGTGPLLGQLAQVLSIIVLPIGLLVSIGITLRMLPQRPNHRPKWWWLRLAAEWALMPIIVPVFVCLPAIDAQTRLSLRRYLGFRVTVKERTNVVTEVT